MTEEKKDEQCEKCAVPDKRRVELTEEEEIMELVKSGIDIDAVRLATKTIVNEVLKVDNSVTRGNLLITHMAEILLKVPETNIEAFGLLKLLEDYLVEIGRKKRMQMSLAEVFKRGKITPVKSVKELEEKTEPMSSEAKAAYDR